MNIWFFENDSDAMQAFNIRKGTILFIDRKLTPSGGNIVIVFRNDTWLVRQLRDINGKRELITGCRNESPIPLKDEELKIWRVVTWTCSPQI